MKINDDNNIKVEATNLKQMAEGLRGKLYGLIGLIEDIRFTKWGTKRKHQGRCDGQGNAGDTTWKQNRCLGLVCEEEEDARRSFDITRKYTRTYCFAYK
jgi:hypothetical protein